MNAIADLTRALADAELEAAIAVELELCLTGKTYLERLQAFTRCEALSAMRTPRMRELARLDLARRLS